MCSKIRLNYSGYLDFSETKTIQYIYNLFFNTVNLLSIYILVIWPTALLSSGQAMVFKLDGHSESGAHMLSNP